MDNKRYNVKN